MTTVLVIPQEQMVVLQPTVVEVEESTTTVHVVENGNIEIVESPVTVVIQHITEVSVDTESVEVVTVGIQGPRGVPGITWQGEWDEETEYVLDDGVSYEGSSYVCILASEGDEPPNEDHWLLVAEKGEQGVPGDPDTGFSDWLSTDPFDGYATETWVGEQGFLTSLHESTYDHSLIATALQIERFKYGIQPTESPDGSRVEFTVPDGYVVGTLRVYMGTASGHMRLFGITATNGITVILPLAPLTEESLYFDYITPAT